jgi:hypothetical protein
MRRDASGGCERSVRDHESGLAVDVNAAGLASGGEAQVD